MKILLTTESFYPNISGVAVSSFLLARTLHQLGHEVIVFAPSTIFQNHRDQLTELPGVRIERFRSLPNPFRQGFRIAFHPEIHAHELIGKIKPDLIHLEDPNAVSRASANVGEQLGIPLVVTNHFLPDFVMAYLGFLGPFKPLAKRKLVSTLQRFYNRCETIITPTETVAKVLRAWPVEPPVQAISNGVDTERFSPGKTDALLLQKYHLPTDQPLILCVGRLDRDKSVPVLMEAIPKVLKQTDAHFVFTGGGDFYHSYADKVKHLPFAQQVTFTGPIPHEQDDLPGLYRSARLFVIASTIETQSIVTLEAMSSGLPIVAAKAGALTELVENGQNGLLFPPSNSTELARSIVELITNKPLVEKMGKASLQKVQAHKLAVVHQQIIDIYQSVLKAKIQ